MIRAAIFDMDGLLLESESRWRIAEHEAVARLGIPLGEADFDATMGVRMHDVAKIWFDAHPWDGPSTDDVAEQVIDRVIELCAGADPLPGVERTLDLIADAGLPVALCSSSSARMIDAVLEGLGLADRFEVTHSAEHDEYGKPHPMPYLVTAEQLGVDPRSCVVFEDSLTGCLSATAARMRCIAVPAPHERGSGRFGFVDAVLTSLDQFDLDLLDSIGADRAIPNLSRPRFHLAFGVDDLDRARTFYGEILGCAEGRSDEHWIDFDLHGHQIVAHLDPEVASRTSTTNPVDGHDVPANHFGLLLPIAAWDDLVERLQKADVEFLMEPTTRFAGTPGEQRTCFVADPAGNALEFKAFADDRQVFAR